MPMDTVSSIAPNYVLIDDNLRIGPKIVATDIGIEYTAIYGFSDKGPYDAFCRNSQRELKPYPLVKRYLRTQMDAQAGGIQLVVLDAAGPQELDLHAATIEAVLEALETRSAYVTAPYRLTFDNTANAYRVDAP